MTRELDDLSDAELIERAREGDSPAYGILWKRHWNAGRAMAASVTGRFEPDDLASEAFARILKSIEKGSGPRSGFRSYLATTVRNVAIDWSRRKATPNIEDPDIVEDWTYSELTALDRIERDTVAEAFYTLPESWQEVLWYTVVEDMQPRDVAPLLGLTPNAVSALSARAREGLRQAWITAHLAEADGKDPAHTWTVAKLGSYVRGRLSRTDHRRVAAHLDTCDSCTQAAEEADHVGSRLALGLLPLFLGVSGAVGYSAWASGQSSGAVAATLPTYTLAGRSGRLRHLLQSAASGSSVGVTTVAASVITAVALTAAVTGSAGPEVPAASAESRPKPTDAQDADALSQPAQDAPDAVAPDAVAPVDVPEPSQHPVPAEGTGAYVGPARAAPAVPPTVTAPGTAPKVSPETPETPPGSPEIPPSSPETPPGSPETPPGSPETPPGSPETPPATPETPPGSPETPPASTPAGCEAAVRSVTEDDTVFAYRLDESDDATTAIDFVHGVTGRYDQPRSAPGWSLSDGVLRPATDVFTVQVWFRADSGGGRLLGFSSDVSGTSWAYDRHVFLTDDGRVVFGVFPGTVHTISSATSYTDGAWHQVTATLSGDGMALFVDGQQVAADPTVTSGHAFAGYWRVGADNLANWGAETPNTRAFPGTLAFAAVYRIALTAEQIRTQWELCR
ncbi:sigma-70 family RNA polymerase sigma factor [Leifsonia sp. NPDC077715]|uniref:sigma-70 family RNA polymerase sigma factor n=1 Tax=Leifsonia sp. NPDC077715 TaxID=3155539 RepID=UPI003438CAD8